MDTNLKFSLITTIIALGVIVAFQPDRHTALMFR